MDHYIKKTQPEVIRLLENSFQKDRLSHAYLFEGERGTNKFATALYFAQMLLCTSDSGKPCQVCDNCKRVVHKTHPNVLVIEPQNGIIKKNQIQALQDEFSKTAVEPGRKVYIVKDIETIHVAAANSLLKFLEEPHPSIHAILTTSNIRRTLPTIISRSQVISFPAIDQRIIYQKLLDEGLSPEIARIASNLTNNVQEAIAIASSEYFLDCYDAVTSFYRKLADGEKGLPVYFNQNFSIIFQDKEFFQLLLSMMILYQKDILYTLDGDLLHIVFLDKQEELNLLAGQKTKQERIKELERMLSLKGKIRSYINIRLAFDNLFLDLESR